jgi:hypothetical protein
MKKMMDELCPRKILLKGVPSESPPFSIPEEINIKIGGFESIVSFSRFDVYVMPLLCRESRPPYCIDYEDKEKLSEFQKKLFDPGASKYACKSGFDMAHLYIHTVKIKKHYIVAFIDCAKLQEIDALVARLCETAEWLAISDQCPVFYVCYYSKRDIVLGRQEPDKLVLENIKRKTSKAIKSCVAYNKDKDVVFTKIPPSRPGELRTVVINSKQNEIGFNPG